MKYAVLRDSKAARVSSKASRKSSHSFQVAVSGVRRALQEATNLQVVEYADGEYRINPELEVEVDVETGVGDLITFYRSTAEYPQMFAAILSIILVASVSITLAKSGSGHCSSASGSSSSRVVATGPVIPSTPTTPVVRWGHRVGG